MRERNRVRVVCDQHGSPTYAVDLAHAILSIISAGKREFGLYNYTNEGETTWYDFAVSIHDEARAAGILHNDCVIEPISTHQYPTRALRPAYSVLSTDKIRQVYRLAIPDWRNSLHRYFMETPFCQESA